MWKTENSSSVDDGALKKRPTLALMIVAWMVACVAVSVGLGALISAQFALSLSPVGCINSVAIGYLIGWQLMDLSMPRRRIYEAFGKLEPRPRFFIRSGRLAVLISLLFGATLSASFPQSPGEPLFGNVELIDAALMVGAYIAAIGLIYTNHIKEKGDRAASTLDAVNNQFYGTKVTDLQAVVFSYTKIARARAEKTAPPNDVETTENSEQPTVTETTENSKPPHDIKKKEDPKLSIDFATTKTLKPLDLYGEVDQLADRPFGPKSLKTSFDYPRTSLSFDEALSAYINALDHVALGVRIGQFDYATVMLALRQRFVRIAFVFHEYINQVTNAVPDKNKGQGYKRSQSRTWEHFLWLTYHLPKFESDNVEVSKITLPPDQMITE